MANDTTTPGPIVPTSAPQADDVSLDAIFQSLIVGVTGLPGPLVRPRWQPIAPKEPEPSVTWCALGVMNETADAFPAVLHNGADAGGLGTDTLYRHIQIEVLFSFYGALAQQYAEMARDGLFMPTNNSTLASASMVFTGEVDSVKSVPELFNQQWRRRYDLLAYFRRQIVRTYNVRNLTAAEVDINTDAGKLAAAIIQSH